MAIDSKVLMLFSNDRTALRQAYRDAWRKRQQGEPLEALEAMIAEVVAMHPEYHATLDSEAGLARDFSPEAGESNPFLHMALHIAIQEQLRTDRPLGIADSYRRLLDRTGDAHEVEHRIMDCLAELIWQAQRNGEMPDEAGYLRCVQRIDR